MANARARFTAWSLQVQKSSVDNTNHLSGAPRGQPTSGTVGSPWATTMAQGSESQNCASDTLDVARADRGYFTGEENPGLAKQAGSRSRCQAQKTSGAKSAGRFGKPDLV